MTRISTAWFVATALAFATTAEAQTVDLSWDQCIPIQTDKLAPNPGGPVKFHASVIGQAAGHQAYQVWWIVGDSNNQIPDAWRFDAAGCNGGFFTFSSQPPSALAKSCPPFVPAATQQFTIPVFQLAPPPLGYPVTMGNGFLAVSYPATVQNPNAATRYHLASFLLDFTFGTVGQTPPDLSSCGGMEIGTTIRLIPDRVSWLDLQSVEHPFQIGNSLLRWNGGAVPANASTWGSIKNQYRR